MKKIVKLKKNLFGLNYKAKSNRSLLVSQKFEDKSVLKFLAPEFSGTLITDLS